MTPREQEAALRLDFKVAVLAVDGRCLVHDDPADCDLASGLQAHHVVTQQQIRDAGRHDLLWDPRNGMAACYTAHRRHHNGTERIPYERLPERCVAFAEQHGFAGVLDRFYPRTP